MKLTKTQAEQILHIDSILGPIECDGGQLFQDETIEIAKNYETEELTDFVLQDIEETLGCFFGRNLEQLKEKLDLLTESGDIL